MGRSERVYSIYEADSQDDSAPNDKQQGLLDTISRISKDWRHAGWTIDVAWNLSCMLDVPFGRNW